MVDLEKIPRLRSIGARRKGMTRIPKNELRDFDADPLLIQVDGHVLIVKNNEVYHSPQLCKTGIKVVIK